MRNEERCVFHLSLSSRNPPPGSGEAQPPSLHRPPLLSSRSSGASSTNSQSFFSSSENCFVAALPLYKVVCSVSADARFLTKISSFLTLWLKISLAMVVRQLGGCWLAGWRGDSQLVASPPLLAALVRSLALTLLSDRRDHQRSPPQQQRPALRRRLVVVRPRVGLRAPQKNPEVGNFRILLKFIWNPMFHSHLLGYPTYIWFDLPKKVAYFENTSIYFNRIETSIHDILDGWSIIAQKIIFSLYSIDHLINHYERWHEKKKGLRWLFINLIYIPSLREVLFIGRKKWAPRIFWNSSINSWNEPKFWGWKKVWKFHKRQAVVKIPKNCKSVLNIPTYKKCASRYR